MYSSGADKSWTGSDGVLVSSNGALTVGVTAGEAVRDTRAVLLTALLRDGVPIIVAVPFIAVGVADRRVAPGVVVVVPADSSVLETTGVRVLTVERCSS